MGAIKFPVTKDRTQIAVTAKGLVGEAYALGATASTATAWGGTGASSTLVATLVGLRAGDVVTNLVTWVAATGTASLTKLGLWTKAGVLLGVTADLSGSMVANTYLPGAVAGAPVTITADDGYYIGGLCICSVTPTFYRQASTTNIGTVIGSGARQTMQVAAQSDITGNVTPANANTCWWFAAS